ncbi:putative leader peptide [Pseudonocardia adelaidensis]|uniref:putative leader peptide n=1 Tax=Pseudonocardia adelaidensis TaxID=648754 RepID=UPI003CD07CCA
MSTTGSPRDAAPSKSAAARTAIRPIAPPARVGVGGRAGGIARFPSAVSPLPACGRRWIVDRTSGTLTGMHALALRLVARRHVDLRRVSSALCRSR